MSIKMAVQNKNGVSVIAISGKLTMGEGTIALRDKIEEMAETGSDRILLNMAGVTYIDSSGIGELVAAHAHITSAGGEMKLLNVARRVLDVLKITRLYTVFEVFEDEDSAIRSFAATEAA
jgi:anti-sigma B factor antagonist